MDAQSVELMPQTKSGKNVSMSRKKKEKNLQDKAEYLEDISTLTPEYIASKFKSHLFDFQETPPFKGNMLSLVRVLEAINEPSEGKRYIMPYGTNFLFKQGSEVVLSKNIEPIILPVSEGSIEPIIDYIRNITNAGAMLGEGELMILKRKVETMRSMITMLSSLNSRVYSTFKSRLSSQSSN